jgi:hypothetical protein
MARTVSRTKETNPYESTAITEVRVEGCAAELARACFPDQSLSRVQRTGRWFAFVLVACALVCFNRL